MLLEEPVLAIVLVAIFLLVAYPVHEFAHAWAAYMQGDATAKLFGRLTLNPIVHFDPIGGTLTAVSLMFSPILFGWAKPTPVNPANFRDRRNGDLIVALAGPLSNLVMALIGAFIVRIVVQLAARACRSRSRPGSTTSSRSTSCSRSSTSSRSRRSTAPRSCTASSRRRRPGRSARSSGSTGSSS